MSDGLFTREEVLEGLPARRAATLLFLIESRTGHLVAQARQAMERFLTEEAAHERDLAFLEAFTLGREPPLRPTIQDLERYAPAWSDLVPANPRIRAALAHALAQKYTFAHEDVPGIRRALGLDDESVVKEYARLYRVPLQSIFAPDISPMARVRWLLARLSHRLETLPPFWTAFSLTLTETVGAGLLGLPIGIARLGLVPGLILLVAFGVVNIITIACISEAVARSGPVRYGEAFIGRLIADYLGDFASSVTTPILVMLTMLVLAVYYVGASTTLDHTVHLPAMLGTALLFLAGLFLLSRKSLNATISSALITGAINLALILMMCVLALPHLHRANVSYVHVPFFRGVPFQSSILATVFGIILTAYFGHLSMGNCARVVLRRDPSARSFMLGGIAAQAAAMSIYCIWAFCINGAISPGTLAGQSSTALVPLTQLVGPLVILIGSIYVVLAMGMASVHYAMALRNLVRERLPHYGARIVALPRMNGTLVFRPPTRALRASRRRDSTHLGLTYLGLQRGQPRFRLALNTGPSLVERVVTVRQAWTLAGVPELASAGVDLAFDVLDAQDDSVTLRVLTPLRVSYEGDWATTGLRPADILELAEPQRRLVQWILRQGQVSVADVARLTSQSEAGARAALGRLVEQGVLEEVAGSREPRYRAHLARKRGSGLPDDIWEALGNRGTEGGRRKTEAGPRALFRLPPSAFRLEWVEQVIGSERGRTAASLSPLVVIFAVTEWLIFRGAATFAGLLNLVGVVAISVFAGMFPTLLLVSARRKGDYVPALVFRALGWPPIVIGVYLLFVANIFVHGLIIWQNVLQQAVALAIGLLIVVTTVNMVRRGAFTPRVVVEVRAEDAAKDASFQVSAAGRPIPVRVQLDYEGQHSTVQAASGAVPSVDSLHRATFHLPAAVGAELKVWAHRVTRDGKSEALPATVTIGAGQATVDLQLAGGQFVLPLKEMPCSVGITMKRPGTAAQGVE